MTEALRVIIAARLSQKLKKKERESGKVSPRLRQGHGEFDGELGVDDFVGALSKEVAGRTQASGL